jgi:4-hydroxythreonine-4-phosphate dehydrogenase
MALPTACIGITIGDPSGIGPEIVLKALSELEKLEIDFIPVVFGHKKILERTAKYLDLPFSFKIFNAQKTISVNALLSKIVYYISPDISLKKIPKLGEINAEAGRLSYLYLLEALKFAKSKKINAIATAPIHKEALKAAKVPFIDHTEILTHFTNSLDVLTLFIAKKMKVFFYSKHIPFKDIPQVLNKEQIIKMLRNCHIHLKKMGTEKPKIALAALNPHAGDGGMFGGEEIDILIPAVKKAQQLDIAVEGPIPADSVFHLNAEGIYDAVLSLYHDQGHIAAKTYDFYGTVSLTLGLPFLRSSVDHGTAMDLAPFWRANPKSMIEAIRLAAKYSF